MIVVQSNIFPNPVQAGSGVEGWDYTWPIKKTPVYNTIKQVPANFVGEVHIGLNPYPVWNFDLDIPFMKGLLSTPGGIAAVQQILGFYGQQNGDLRSWYYLDPYDNGIDSSGDYIVNNIGVADGENTVFQTTRNVGGLVDLIQNFNGVPKVYLNGILQVSGYNIDPYGTLTFNSPPEAGKTVTWTGSFYFRCFFSEGKLPTQMDLFSVWSCNSLKFRSVLR